MIELKVDRIGVSGSLDGEKPELLTEATLATAHLFKEITKDEPEELKKMLLRQFFEFVTMVLHREGCLQ